MEKRYILIVHNYEGEDPIFSTEEAAIQFVSVNNITDYDIVEETLMSDGTWS